MSRVWKIAVPLAVVIVVGGYAVGSLAASDLDDVTPRQPIVISDDADTRHGAGDLPDDRRERPDQKDDQRGDDGRADDTDDDDDVAVVRPDVDDLDDDDGDDGDDDHHDGGDRADD